MSKHDQPGPGQWSVLRLRDYRWLLLGESVSVLGTQFHIVALQWFVLQMSDSGWLLGLVLTVAAVPRAVLMLVGGAMSDAFSPRLIMIVSNLARAVFVAGLALLAAAVDPPIAALLILVFLFGVADAFFYPAYMTLLPRLVPADQRAAANSLLQSSMQMMGLIGPAAAGALVAAVGIAAAFWIDSFSFLMAGAAVLAISAAGARAAVPAQKENILKAVAAGLRYGWSDRRVRALLLVTAAANIAFIGPFVVGTAVLADRVFGSAESLGIMLGASAGGALLGTLAAGAWPMRRFRGPVVLVLLALVGLSFILLGSATSIVAAATVRALIGAAAGYMNVVMLTLLQQIIRSEMMGRVMSLVMLMSVGLHPLSYMAAGLLVELGLRSLFFIAAALLVGAALAAALNRDMRRLE